MPFGLIAPYLVIGCGAAVDYTQYWPTIPGTTWRMHTHNYLTGGEADVTVTIEAPTTFGGYPVTPWRFRKTSPDAYWGPGGNYDLRWMVVDPTYTYPGDTFFNEFFFAIGHHAIDIATQEVAQEVAYHSRSVYPAYALSLRRAFDTFDVLNDHGQTVSIAGLGTTYPLGTVVPNPTFVGTPPGVLIPYSWWLRIKPLTRTPDADALPGWSETVQGVQHLLRFDFYEAGGPGHDTTATIQTADSMLRESWYFQLGIGLVEIRTKGVIVGGTPYQDDPLNFQGDEIVEPTTITWRVP